MKRDTRHRRLLALSSLAALLAAYTLVSNAYRFVDPDRVPEALSGLLRPDILPPTQAVVAAFGELLRQGAPPPADESGAEPPGDGRAEPYTPARPVSEQMGTLQREGVTLPVSLLITTARVLFGLAVGLPLGFLVGFLLGWSRRIDDYLHPIYVLVRSVPPLALITYIMLWLGHTEAHRLIPIVYAVAAAVVIPAYHGVRDVANRYLVAARSLGARGRLLLAGVILPAARPALLGGLRYSIAIAWMTAVGAEMLMADNGMGYLLVGGGMWSTRLQTRTDPAVVMAGIIALAAAGWAMDAAAKAAGARLTRWAR